VIAQVKPSVVLILGRRPGEISSGTGFVVEGGRIATCNHVVEGATELLVVADGKQLTATVAAADPHVDLAILTCREPLPAPLRLADGAEVRDGDEVAVTGYPVVGKMIGLGYEAVPSTTRGTVSAHRKRRRDDGAMVDELQIDAAINPGNSGGPVYSTRDGSVIGIASSKLVEEQGMGFALSAEMLRRMLRQ
jgi:serine protease Do